MPDEHGNETREEAEERIRIVRATQIFGDTPTDPTIGDVVVPAHDEEGANAAAAAVAAEAEEGNDEAADLSPEEAKRQLEPSAEELEEGGAEVADEDDEDADASDDSEEDEGDRKAADVISDIESADSADEVDRLAEGDERVTVKRAADKRKEELSE
jgi:hypothetical protein